MSITDKTNSYETLPDYETIASKKIGRNKHFSRSNLVRIMSEAVFEQTGERVSQKKMAIALKAALDGIIEQQSIGNKVHLDNFGSFELKAHKATIKKHPVHKTKIYVPAATYVRFNPSAVYKNKIKESVDPASL